MRIAVAGAGAFGTALAIALLGRGHVALVGRGEDRMRELALTRYNQSKLPDVVIPEEMEVTSDPNAMQAADIVLLCVPTQKLSKYLSQHVNELAGKPLIACCKGIDVNSLAGPTQVVAKQVPSAIPAILTGPSFAADIARGLPTALTLASASEEQAERLQNMLTRPALRLYRSTDVIGAELGGALKNVVAIAAGVCIGAGLGESARAALITRGFAEMRGLADSLGARPETLMGLSGFGDLLLTCSSPQSRNFSHGLALGRGETSDGSKTVEGVATAKAVSEIARQKGLDLPVAQAVTGLVTGQLDVETALQTLLSRPVRAE